MPYAQVEVSIPREDGWTFESRSDLNRISAFARNEGKAWVLTLYESIKFDDPLKRRHSRTGGNPEIGKLSKRLNTRFYGNDGKGRY